MKRFTKLMALGLAAVLTFGMTAQAATSPDTTNTNDVGKTYIDKVTWSDSHIVDSKGNEVKADALTPEEVTAVNGAKDNENVNQAIKEALGENFVVKGTVTAFDLSVPKGEIVTVTLSVPELKAGVEYVILHYPNGTSEAPQVIELAARKGNLISFTIVSGSPFALVEVGAEVVDETPAPTPVPTPVPTDKPDWTYTEVDGVWFKATQGGADDFSVEQVEVSQGFIFSSETDAAVKEAMGDKFRVTDNILAAFNFYAKNANGTPVEVWSPKFELDHKYVLVYYVNGLNEEPQVIELDVNNNYESYFNAMSGGPYYYCYIVEVVAEDRPAGVPGNSDNVNDASVPTAAAPGTSPKTGETLPMAGVMALILMAGAALCAVKVRYNKQ